MEKYIDVNKRTRDNLKKIFNVSDVTIWKALTYEGQNDLAQRIRKAAFENGGIEMAKLPVMETLHDADDYIRQYLPGEILIEFDKHTGEGFIYKNGALKKHYDLVKISQIPDIQKCAISM